MRYTPTAIALHWAVALLVLVNFAFGLYLVGLPLSPQKLRYFSWHKWVGVTVFALATARLLWRLRHAPPALPASMAPWELRASRASHFLLYVLVFAVPLSGWLFSSATGFQTVYLGVLPIPDLLGKNRELADFLKIIHRWTNYSMAAIVALHVTAALKHRLVDRDELLARMLPLPRRP